MSSDERPDGSESDEARRTGRGWTPLPGRFRSAPTPVRQALDTLASTLGLADVDAVTQLFGDWPSIVGDDLASHCRPKSLRNRTLVVEAVDQQWATELGWMTRLMVDRCCAALGEGAVTAVRVVHVRETGPDSSNRG